MNQKKNMAGALTDDMLILSVILIFLSIIFAIAATKRNSNMQSIFALSTVSSEHTNNRDDIVDTFESTDAI